MKRWGIIITLAYVLLWLGLALEFDWGYLEDGFTHDISHGDIFEAPLTCSFAEASLEPKNPRPNRLQYFLKRSNIGSESRIVRKMECI